MKDTDTGADKAAAAQVPSLAELDLRSFLQAVQEKSPREWLHITEPLDAAWELAAVTSALQDKMRMPVIRFDAVTASQFPVIHNVCASLPRIAKSVGISAADLERRLDAAYDALIPPVCVTDAPVRDQVYRGDAVDLRCLPQVRYTETETCGYLSAAHVVARDPESGALNISFHRLMLLDAQRLAIYMTSGGHLDRIFQHNASQQLDTHVAVFIGAHPLWSLGSLAAGSLSLDEYEVIGGLLGAGLPVTTGLLDERLLIPAAAEIVLEGTLSMRDTAAEGPYGEAFGFVSGISERPVLTVTAMSHRNEALFQDIVPGKLEHMTMTGTAVQVHLKKRLCEQFDCIRQVFLPTAMTVYIGVSREAATADGETLPAHDILTTILAEQRFVKHAVLFDDDVDVSNSKQTQRALAMHVQADRDLVMLPEQPGNGLDPSERDEKTTKWGIDATSCKPGNSAPLRNQLPAHVVSRLDISALIERARQNS